MKKSLYIIAMIIGVLILASGITNPTDIENLRVMASIGIMGWATIIYKVETKTE